MKIIFLQLVMLVCLSFGKRDISTSDYQGLSASLKNLEKEFQNLKHSQHYVAFSAALRPPTQDSEGYGQTGPYDGNVNLVHSHVITNVGGAYIPITGSFVAPVHGLYFFTFTSYSWLKEANIGVALYKNTEEVSLIYEYQDKGDNEDFASSGITLELVKGDQVYLVLPSGFSVTSNAYRNLSTFSGFLISQMS